MRLGRDLAAIRAVRLILECHALEELFIGVEETTPRSIEVVCHPQ